MNVFTETDNYICSIEGSIFSNFFSLTVSIKTRKWIKKISETYFELELTPFQFLCFGNIILFFDILLIYHLV